MAELASWFACTVLMLAMAPLQAMEPDAVRATGYVGRIDYTGEVFADLAGGKRPGAVYTGLLQATLDWHWRGWATHADAYFPHGESLTRQQVGDFSVVSNIDAVHQLRLHQFWGQRTLGPFSLRLGVLAADTEFWVSDTAALFLNSAFGAPSVVSGNLQHPPIFPQGVPGIRVAADLGSADTLRLALFDGDGGDPTSLNPHGLRFAFNRGALLVAEDQHVFGPATEPLASARIGVFVHTGGSAGAATSSTALQRWGLIAAIDKSVNKRLTCFARAGISPGGRSAVPWSTEAGCDIGAVHGSNNTLGVAFAWVDLEGQAAMTMPTQRLLHEAIIESTYNMVFSERMSLQPDIQYVIDPGGTIDAHNAWVLGFRMNLALAR